VTVRYRYPAHAYSYTVRQTVTAMERGYYRIPRFQRPYVWTDAQILALLDSLRRGIWTGAILVWERYGLPTDPHPMPGTGRPVDAAGLSLNRSAVVVDGQQRLGALARVFTVPGFSWDTTAQEFRADESGDVALHTMHASLFGCIGRDAPEARVRAVAGLYDDLMGAELTVVTAPPEWTLAEVLDQFRRMNTTGTPMDAAHLAAALDEGDL